MKSAPANRIPSLDGLRAMSILFVIVGHFWSLKGPSVLLAGFGVHVFFVLSGYLITQLLQKEYEREGRIDLVAFYRRRCFRIFPAAYTYILVVALLSPVSRSGLIYAVTYTVSYHLNSTPLLFWHLWSLSVEEQFYLLWPLALLLGFARRAWIAWLTMLLAAMFRLALGLNPSLYSITYLHYSFPGTMDSIAAGCLLAIYGPQIRERFRWMAESNAIVIAIPVTAWTLDAVFWGDTSLIAVRSMAALWGAVPLLIAFWIFLLIERQDWILNNPVASAVGVLSYSLYLWQQAFTVDHKHSTVVALLMLAGCAIASYVLVEKPMLKLGASIKSRKQRRDQLERSTLSPVLQTEMLQKND
jgi:peptidoglycan/LPS O-acetylase OafA/YrhL